MTSKGSMSNASHDPGAAVARERADAVSGDAATPVHPARGHSIRFGTASWTDPTIIKGGVFYPEGVNTPEDRLRYYASRFPLVEVDSTYYALPARRVAELWVERTPARFTFDVKAHALMTGQPSEVQRLPKAFRDALPGALGDKTRIYGKDLPDELLDELWHSFLEALAPLQGSGKLGSILLQYPRWFMPGDASRAAILDAQRRLEDVVCAVEFRSARWFDAHHADDTIRFLEENGLPFVIVDEPQGLASSVPPIAAVTSSALAIFRMHGRRADTWERKGVATVERYRYLYDPDELLEWVPRIQSVASRVREAHVLMNNCYANYGTTNALEIAALVHSAYGEQR
ncbi:MAG: DUF72 domain-containing protein [Gemmatimonadaceae bacterium]